MCSKDAKTKAVMTRRQFVRAAAAVPIVTSSSGSGSWAAAAGIEEVDILIKNALVVTVDDNRTVIPNGAIAIMGGRIAAIGQSDYITAHLKAGTTIDGAGKMVMPGLVNTHLHAGIDPHIFLGPHPSSTDWIDSIETFDGAKGTHWANPLGYLNGTGGLRSNQKNMYDELLELPQTPEQDRVRSLHTMALEILGGTTSFIEGSGGPLNAVAEATQVSGLRGVMTNFVHDLSYDPAKGSEKMDRVRDADRVLQESEDYASRYNGAADGRLSWYYSMFTGTTTSDELMRGIKQLADRDDTGIYTHSSAAWDHDDFNVMAHAMRCIERLDSFDILGPNWLGVHVGWVNDAEIKRLGDTRSNICHAIAAGMLYGKGITTTKVWPKLIDAGANLSLGTDDKWNGAIFQEARLAHTVHKDIWGDNRYFPYYQVVEMLTRNGARGIGLDDCGFLAPGAKADMIIVDIDHPRYTNPEGPLSVFISRGEAADINTTIVDGALVMRDREILTFDVEQMVADYRQHAGLSRD